MSTICMLIKCSSWMIICLEMSSSPFGLAVTGMIAISSKDFTVLRNALTPQIYCPTDSRFHQLYIFSLDKISRFQRYDPKNPHDQPPKLPKILGLLIDSPNPSTICIHLPHPCWSNSPVAPPKRCHQGITASVRPASLEVLDVKPSVAPAIDFARRSSVTAWDGGFERTNRGEEVDIWKPPFNKNKGDEVLPFLLSPFSHWSAVHSGEYGPGHPPKWPKSLAATQKEHSRLSLQMIESPEKTAQILMKKLTHVSMKCVVS